jgi:hypothetical protein
MKKLLSVLMVMVGLGLVAQGTEKEERIKRDVEVAENVLSTLIRQQMERKNSFWGFEVKGSYTPGYGVTLRIPYDNWNYAVGVATTSPVVWGSEDRIGVGQNGVTIIDRSRMKEELAAKEMADSDLKKLKEEKAAKRDSARNAYGDRLLEASKMFLADYGDLMGLEPNEKIMITTKSERGGNYNFSWSGDANYKVPKRKVISVEATKSDLTQFKQGKITREQLLAKFKVINSDLSDESQPDLELLSTILGRLYRSDLSKSFFTESAPYYERMKDFGVTFYMQVYSSNDAGNKRWNMPTVDLSDQSQEERDKKVKELYPLFEKDIKENLLEYGRTLSSLKDEELLILDVTLTRCVSCGIPATVELSVKASVLKEYGSGKLSKEAAIAKINVKKGAPQ